MAAPTPYDDSFYALQRGGSAQAAALVAPWLVETFRPRRVVDVGCGVGTWAAAFLAQGVPDVVGMDGDYVDRAALEIPAGSFRALDLADPGLTDLPERFDMSVCLEVAEHLPPARSEGFVRFVASLAPVAVFGAAIPGQPGVDHINPRWQSYWAGLFAQHGFVAHDILRPRFWASGVDYWYAQNTIVYVSRAAAWDGAGAARPEMLDLAHPQLVEALRAKIGRRKPRPAWLATLRKRLKIRLPSAR